MAITINGTGTLTGVSVGGLPDGIVDTDMIAANAVATAKIADNAVTAAKRGAGAILQVAQSRKTDTQSTTSDTAVDISGLSVTITPSSTSNKLWITGLVQVGEEGDTCCNIFIDANGTKIGGSTTANGGAQSAQPQDVHTGLGYNYGDNSLIYRVLPVKVDFLYSPNSTSAQTIKLQMSETDNTGNLMYINRSNSDNNALWVNRQTSSLTVMEVAG
jgi:hypothetical protein